MITLKNLNQPKAIPAFFDTKEDFIEYTIEEATQTSLPTGEVPTMQKWGFTKVVDDVTTNEYGKEDELIHWEADMDACLKFWSNAVEGWQVKIASTLEAADRIY